LRTLIVLVALGSAGLARAGGDERIPPVTDPVVKKECGSCHMLFPPQFLPKRSWQKLMDGLSSHFGENASLAPAQRAAVLEVLLAHAADAPGAGRAASKFAASVPDGETPLRITETARWVREHRKIRADKWTSPAVKSKLNCVACHKQAEQGIFEDD
jgi:hypothetical protein